MRKVLYIFGQLSDQDTDWLASVGRRLYLEPGETLIRQGIRIEQLFIVLDGELKVMQPGGKEIARVGSGDILGEMSFIDNSPTFASVEAQTKVVVLAIEQRLIKERLERDTAFAARFYKAIASFLADRMRNTMARFGYGESPEDAKPPSSDQVGELDENVLDNVHLAGGRFERMLKKLMG